MLEEGTENRPRTRLKLDPPLIRPQFDALTLQKSRFTSSLSFPDINVSRALPAPRVTNRNLPHLTNEQRRNHGASDIWSGMFLGS